MREAVDNRLALDQLTEDWAAVKRIPDQTGLSRAVWITENQGYPHDVRVKVSRLRSGRGRWPDAVFVSVRPVCHEIVSPGRRPELLADDLAEVCRWIELNRDVIIEFWDGAITPDEAIARLRPLPKSSAATAAVGGTGSISGMASPPKNQS